MQQKVFVVGKVKARLITVIRWEKMFCSGCKKLNDQAREGTVDSEAMLQAIDTNLIGSTQRVSGELNGLQSSVVYHLHNLSKSIQSYRIVSQVTKILQKF